MTTPITNSVPYLRTSREYPEDQRQLIVELTKTYIDVANAVNSRTIGIFAETLIVTGERWSSSIVGENKQSIRKIFPISDSNLTVTHDLSFARITNIYGTATNGTISYPIPYVDVTNVNNQIALTISATQIVVTKGAGAPPAIISGLVIVEYIP